jgi:predicted DNA-binding protein (MmcQ/YjbR family)
MNLQQLREFCLSKNGVTEALPFDDTVLVFKVLNKIFLLTNIETFESINLKCDPEYAIELREQYDAIIPGYHMNKKHWNTLKIDGSLNQKMIFDLVDHSYELVIKGMSKKEKESLLL